MQVFTLAASTGRPFLILVPALVIVALVAALLIALMFAPRTVRFEVSRDGVRLRGDLYGRFIPANLLVADKARRVDLSSMPDLVPARRTMGTGLPGYQSGWFRLRNGDKALLYLTDRTKAVYVPTTADYGLLLSPNDPESFVAAVKAAGKSR